MSIPDDAYAKYLKAFPLFWKASCHVPETRREFPRYYKMALKIDERFGENLSRGLLDPVVLYLKVCFDAFLGIAHTHKEFSAICRFAFIREMPRRFPSDVTPEMRRDLLTSRLQTKDFILETRLLLDLVLDELPPLLASQDETDARHGEE